MTKSRRRGKKNQKIKAASDLVSTSAVNRLVLPPWRGAGLWLLLSVAVVSVVLNSVGLEWGRSGFVPWQADSIEGITTVREMPRLFGQWTYKYPRGQFLINAVFYKPLLDKWEKNPVLVSGGKAGSKRLSVLNQKRLDKLAIISRVISLLMGVGTVISVFMMARLLFKDYLSAVLAGLALAVSELFVFYSHAGNVDVPSIFWFAWGLYWAVKSIYIGKWRHFVLMGLCFSFSICTKDATAGYLAGMVPAFWLAMIGKVRADGQDFKTAVLSVFSRKVLVAILAFLFSYALLQDILTSPQAFADRMSVWIGGRGVVDFNKGFKGQLPLLWNACQMLYSSLGWPLLLMVVISLLYCTSKYPWQSGLVIIPIIAFYVIVVVNIHMVYPRYFLPAFVGLALFVGKCSADWLRCSKVHILLRVLPVALVFGCSLLYCIGLDLEMLNEPRKRTEKWFADNVSRKVVVAGLIRKINYAPRLYIQGFRFICPWKVPANDSDFSRTSLYPRYIIISEPRLTNNDEVTRNFREALLAGQLNYRQVAHFQAKYLYPPKHTVFSLAAWPLGRMNWLSPEIIVFEKK
ncbi:MAG: hypothetical protein GWP06_12655 [Actinobacteria bacterium]|nr:hypothetical protein [Actinomycetota bacterium]